MSEGDKRTQQAGCRPTRRRWRMPVIRCMASSAACPPLIIFQCPITCMITERSYSTKRRYGACCLWRGALTSRPLLLSSYSPRIPWAARDGRDAYSFIFSLRFQQATLSRIARWCFRLDIWTSPNKCPIFSCLLV